MILGRSSGLLLQQFFISVPLERERERERVRVMNGWVDGVWVSE